LLPLRLYLLRRDALHDGTSHEGADDCERIEKTETRHNEGRSAYLRCSLVMSAAEPTEAMLREGWEVGGGRPTMLA
jgi:hypothetical protein